MKLKYLFYLFAFVISYGTASVWNNLNCSAPRAPDNGLSFIFRNGELVHFRCHPGYVMRGKPVAYCVNNVWTEPAPECVPIQKWPSQVQPANDVYNYQNGNFGRNQSYSQTDKHRQLFSWENPKNTHSSRVGAYGDGPRRLPLINGIWPSKNQREQVLALGPQSTPGPKAMVKEEIDIAELRNKQLEELRRQRYADPKIGKIRHKNKKRYKKKNSVTHEASVTPLETEIMFGNANDVGVISIGFPKEENKTENVLLRSKHRHRGNKRKKHHGNKKYKHPFPTSSGFIISRASRVDTSGIAPHHTKYQFSSPRHNEVAELRRRPVEEINHNDASASLDKYDATCIERLYGREVPMIAPQVPNAFVFRYETRKNILYPFNVFMSVKYRCFSGYVFVNPRAQTLFCKEAAWVGEVPRCVRGSALI